MKMISNNSKADGGSNKVLPIIEVDNEEYVEGEKIKSEKQHRSIARMKELLRWAAVAAKSEKGAKFLGRKVMNFRNRTTLKAIADGDQMSNESPKISFRWDVESCSTAASFAYSATSMATYGNESYNNIASSSSTPLSGLRNCSTGKGNWITSDDEFVVLEL